MITYNPLALAAGLLAFCLAGTAIFAVAAALHGLWWASAILGASAIGQVAVIIWAGKNSQR